MKTVLTQFRRLANDANGNVVQDCPADGITSQTLTAVGAATALSLDARMLLVATDTMVTVDVYGTGCLVLVPANTSRLFPVIGGQVVTLA